MTDLPAPLTPPDCDLRDFPRMMIDITRLRQSSFDATADDTAWRAGFNLWMSGFHAVPASSLDDDESVLCKAAGLGRDLKTWRKVKAAAMRGWVLCSDGRWYHETVAEFALEAWLEKLAQRLSSGAGNAKRWGAAFDPEPIKVAIGITSAMLAALNPASKSIQKSSRHISRSSPDGTDKEVVITPDAVPAGSQEKGQGRDREGKGVSVEAKASTGGAAAKLELVHGGKQPDGDKPDWWPKRDRYGRVLGEITDKLLYDLGKAVLGKSAGGMITRLKACPRYRRDWRAIVELLLRTDEASDPKEFFGKALHGAETDDPLLAMHEVFPETEYRA